jgi:hypothetical protein
MKGRMRHLKDPYDVGLLVFIITLAVLYVLPPSPLGYALLVAWVLSIYLIGWGMGHRAKQKEDRESFFF